MLYIYESINVFWLLTSNLFWAWNKFSLVIGVLGCLIGILVFFISYEKFKLNKVNYSFFYIIFFLIVFGLVSTKNIFYFFVFYEMLFFPSFILVFWLAPNRRGILASHYFFFWTQGGSFLVLLVFIYWYSFYNILFFSDLFWLKQTNLNFNLTVILLFMGFGAKFPIWPFHYWLTKTHVEAPTFFSIYLSGFLVKTAVYGFYLVNNNLPCIFLSSWFIPVLFFGVLDSTIKMWVQNDLKKLVAYGTIQEMNLIAILLFFTSSFSLGVCAVFCFTHALLSSLFFYLVELLYRRYKTRNNLSISGLWLVNPTLTLHIILSVILYIGLPFTLKFLVEFSLLTIFYNFSSLLTFILLFILNFIGGFVWIKNWFTIFFGIPSGVASKTTIISKADSFFFTILYLYLGLGGGIFIL